MELSVILAVLEGCEPEAIDDPEQLGQWLDASVAAGRFTELHRYVHRFEPQGLTATVVLAESHIALHSWPELGTLFVDIASCSGRDNAEAALRTLLGRISHRGIRRQAMDHVASTK